MKLVKITTIVLSFLILFFGWSNLNVALAGIQIIDTSDIDLQSTPEPTIGAMQSAIATQQVQLDDLKRELEREKKDREYYDRDLEWKWGIAGALAVAFGSILSLFGIKGADSIKQEIGAFQKDRMKDLDRLQKQWEKDITQLEEKWNLRTQKLLDKALYKFDPSNLPIYLPMNAGMEPIHRMLQLRKFEKVGFYESLVSLPADKLNGVIVVSLIEPNEEKRKTQIGDFMQFVTGNRFDSAKVGFILFTQEKVDKDVLKSFDNLVTANFPATVVSSILVIGRGMDIEFSEKSDISNGRADE